MRFYDFLSYLCIMTSELSILIPCHDYICKPLVEQLALQASSVEGLRYEIIVIDDGSTAARMVEVNRSISRMPFCRHIALTENQGRSKVRNLLAREAKYECLLFIDCKHSLPDGEFIHRYVEASDNDVVDGGIIIQGDPGTGKSVLTINLLKEYISKVIIQVMLIRVKLLEKLT